MNFKRLFFLILTFVVAISFIYLSSSIKNISMISALVTIGTENTDYNLLVKNMSKDPSVGEETKIKIFIGPYKDLRLSSGRLEYDGDTYYIFIDSSFYNSINPDEKEVLIAHEMGHISHRFTKIDKLKFWFWRIFTESASAKYKEELIETGYQISADDFAAKHISPEATINLLNKLYPSEDGRKSMDYKVRMLNLATLPKEALQKH